MRRSTGTGLRSAGSSTHWFDATCGSTTRCDRRSTRWVGAVLAVAILAGLRHLGMGSAPRGRRRFGDRRRKRQRRNVCGRIRSIAPVLNLASARLITGKADTPRSVADKKLSGYPRGPLLGDPWAPSAPTRSGEWRTRMDGIPTGGAVERRYRRCAAERDRGTAGSGGRPHPRRGVRRADLARGQDFSRLPARTATDGGPRRGGPRIRRGPVGTAIGRVAPRPVSAGLLALIPEVPPIALPQIAGKGRKGVLTGPGIAVGRSCARSPSMTPAPITSSSPMRCRRWDVWPAEILRTADARGSGGGRDGAARPDRRAAHHIRTRRRRLSVGGSGCGPGGHPSRRLPVVVAANDRTPARMTLLIGTSVPIPDGASPVPVAGADGGGPSVDSVYVRPGSGEP